MALTPQRPEHSRTQIERHGLEFDLLTDPGNDYAAALGVRFTVPDDLKTVYQSFGIDLPVHNGEPSWTLAIPGRVIVDEEGTVRSALFDPDYTRRPEPETILRELDHI